MTALPPQFLTRPLAHRALHDVSDGRPENSRAAVRAAVDAGYGIEIDVQISADDCVMVFHDYHLDRLTDTTGRVAGLTGDQLNQVKLRGGDEGVPGLPEILDIVDGQVPLVIEIKDQDGQMGPNVGGLEAAVIRDLSGYTGPLALMSFNPHSVAVLQDIAPQIARGLVTCSYTAQNWPHLSFDQREHLAGIPDFDRVGASFISHNVMQLDTPPVTLRKEAGTPILCWTVRSDAVERDARKIADNITFEGYLPDSNG